MKVLAILGESGVGKTTIARILTRGKNFHLIHSYTSRKPRIDELDSRGLPTISDHLFRYEFSLEHVLDHYDVVAHTKIDGNLYWADKKQFVDDAINVYVIDCNGLKMLQENPDFDVFTVLVKNDSPVRTNVVDIPEDFTPDFVFNNNNNSAHFSYIAILITLVRERWEMW